MMPAAERTAAVQERRILCHEHRSLEPLMTHLEQAAGLVGPLAGIDLAGVLRKTIDEFEKTLLPHLAWEETFCYPEIERLTGTPLSTRYLRLQHGQLRGQLERLEADWLLLRDSPTHPVQVALRGHLHAFHALLGAHLEQEEQVLLPLIDADRGAQERRAAEGGPGERRAEEPPVAGGASSEAVGPVAQADPAGRTPGPVGRG